MSRTGKHPVPVPSGVSVDLQGQDIRVKGPKGELSMVLVDDIVAELGNDGISVQPRDTSKRAGAMWGMQRTLVSNMVEGVTQGYTVNLEINGVGFRAAVRGKTLSLQLGYSHEINYPIPDGIQIHCEKPTAIAVSGISRQQVGQVASEIRRFRKPEPYKAKGIKYVDEYVFRKEGKKK